jgi:hypothetical protein|tara:strand:+ start:14825 stop:15427 length:603 start_codon:yes stop_codon:yes gene_type:complete
MSYITQNDLLLNKLMEFYNKSDNLKKMLNIINGTSNISLRIVDWFSTNYSKNYYTVYINPNNNQRFKVYQDYKLNLKAYSKKRFDPFCRWERINIPIEENKCVQTTIGQLNFFRWALENDIIKYIENHYKDIDNDMNLRNSYAKKKTQNSSNSSNSSDSSKSSYDSVIPNNKTRKKREELSKNACRSIKKELVDISILFN